MIDSHVHLDAKTYTECGGVGEVLRAANHVGVDRAVTPALHFDSFQALLRLAQEHPNIYPAVGVHPHEVCPELSDDLEAKLASGLQRLAVPILGETGLEGHYDFTPLPLQLEFLRAHLRVAQTHGVPTILHCRATEQLLYDELRRLPPRQPAVVHCFTGSWEWAQRFLDLGCYIGITGIVTFKNAGDVAEVARRLPLDRLLVETDGPYLAPIPHRGRTNKPEYIPLIVEAIARLRETSVDEIAEATTRNTERLFGLPEHRAIPSVSQQRNP
jgi:TatD DNase family protein